MSVEPKDNSTGNNISQSIYEDKYRPSSKQSEYTQFKYTRQDYYENTKMPVYPKAIQNEDIQEIVSSKKNSKKVSEYK
jgi:hypothetical protein